MIRNYVKIALRNFLRHKGYTVINISGLAIGIACAIIMALFVRNELDYDRFHSDGDRIYRVLRQALDETNRTIGVTSGPYAEALENDFPADIEAVLQVLPNDGLVSHGERSFREENFYFASPNFFQFFSYPLAAGQPDQVLGKPNSIVISREMARKYFPGEDPLGKILTFEKEYDFVVSGVFGEFPGNTHLNFDFVASIEALARESWLKDWWRNGLFTYVRLPANVAPASLETRFPGFMNKYFGEHFQKTGLPMTLQLESLKDIYFNHQTTFDRIPHGDRRLVFMFSAVAVLILLIACVNFMNLATAKSAQRALEVGLRKVMGAYRSHLMLQFVGEAMILVAVALGVALALVEFLLPSVNALFQLQLALDYGDWRLPLLFLGGVVFLGLLAGSYPAFFLSAFRPAKVLKGRIISSAGSAPLRRLLVVGQFTISIFLLISMIVITRQMHYVSAKKLGFDREQVVLLPINNQELYEQRERFKNELRQYPAIQSISLMSGEPGGFHDNFSFQVEGISDGARRMRTVFTDFDYCKTFGLEMVAGRDFSRKFATDSAGIILNETAVARLGWTPQEALGKEIVINLVEDGQRRVIGVVKDYHFTSLKSAIDPLAIFIHRYHRTVAVRLASGNPQPALQRISQAWRQTAPGYPFEYRFLDERLDNLYQAEQRQQAIFGIFAALAILVACLGLFGLATYTAQQRTKEIGIRKVLGASITGIVGLLSKEFLRLVGVAFLLAIPLGYYAMTYWLQDFAYRIALGWEIFLLAGTLTLLIALLTVSAQALKAALRNPADALRYE